MESINRFCQVIHLCAGVDASASANCTLRKVILQKGDGTSDFVQCPLCNSFCCMRCGADTPIYPNMVRHLAGCPYMVNNIVIYGNGHDRK